MPANPLYRPEDKSFLFPSQTLKSLFAELVHRNFGETLRLSDPDVIEYVADLLTRFYRLENLYRIRDARGQALEDVGEMLMASNPLLEGPSFDWEREVCKHIGDFTLFFAGLFPEAIHRWRLRRQRSGCFPGLRPDRKGIVFHRLRVQPV